MKTWPSVLGLLTVCVGISAWLAWGHQAPGAPSGGASKGAGLPWQIEALGEGRVRVLGLTLAAPGQSGGSTLADARALWGNDMLVSLVAHGQETGTLEAYVDPANAGFITGKLVIGTSLSPARLAGMRARASKAEHMDSGAFQFQLSAFDLDAAWEAPITSLSFIPQAQLDEATVLARFGQPAQRVSSDGHLTHFLYPHKGLDLVLDSQGKELLQYVAPADFARLSGPLQAQAKRP